MEQFWRLIAASSSAAGAQRNWRGYAEAALTVAVATLIYLSFGRIFAYSLDLLCLLAVMIAALRGGLYPGLLATALAAISVLLIEQRTAEPAIEGLVRFAFVAGLGALASIGGESHRRMQRSAGQSAETAREREAHLQSILDTAPHAMVVIDEAGIIVRFSNAAENTFGYKRDEAIGKNVRMLMPPPYHGQHDSYIANYLRTGERRVIGIGREVQGLRKSGEIFPMELSIGEVRYGTQRMFTGFARDLSRLREAEARQRQLQQELAHVWRLRSLGEFAATIAHEMNQPLAALSNYLRGARSLALQATPPDPKLIDALSRAGDQAIRAGDIIRRTRGLLGREGVEFQPESLSTLIEEVDALTQISASERGVRMQYAIDAHATIVVDKVQVQQVLLNLLRNAFEALEQSPRKEVLVSTRPSSEGLIMVKIEDSGPGISPEIADRLFHPMASTRAGGMGLGLSISRTIIEDHGGELWTESSSLGGAAFCMTLRTSSHGGADGLERADSLHH